MPPAYSYRKAASRKVREGKARPTRLAVGTWGGNHVMRAPNQIFASQIHYRRQNQPYDPPLVRLDSSQLCMDVMT